MLADQVIALYGKLIRAKTLNPEEPFSILDWTGGGEGLGRRVHIAIQRRQEEFDSWNYRTCPPCDATRGVIILEADTVKPLQDQIESAAQFLADPKRLGFLIVLSAGLFERQAVERFIREIGLSISAVFSERELEFLKDDSGRQKLDLDDSGAVERIYERLVYEGENPVHAWPSALQAVQNFRASGRTILVIGRST